MMKPHSKHETNPLRNRKINSVKCVECWSKLRCTVSVYCSLGIETSVNCEVFDVKFDVVNFCAVLAWKVLETAEISEARVIFTVA